MRITEVKLRMERRPPNPQIKAYAEITIDDALAVDGLRIIETADGRLILCMPSRPKREPGPHGRPEYRDICFPINPRARATIENAVFDAYRRCRDRGLDSIELFEEHEQTSCVA